MQIRPYRASDESAVIDLWSRVLTDSSPHNAPIASIQKKLAVADDLLLVAVAEASVVGTIMGGYDGHRGWIYSVAVSPEFRRKGIGSALVRHVEEMLARRGCSKVNLQIRESNSAVSVFYEQLGYSIEPRISMGRRLDS
jgi:ribosomal protein S18 acetylase RimI-like enzyme